MTKDNKKTGESTFAIALEDDSLIPKLLSKMLGWIFLFLGAVRFVNYFANRGVKKISKIIHYLHAIVFERRLLVDGEFHPTVTSLY